MPPQPPQPKTLEEALVIIEALWGQMQQMHKRIEELERKLAETSRNSSKPPSSDGPDQEPRRRKPSGRSPGGQRGHRGSRRELVDNPDKTIVCKPEVCWCCGKRLRGNDPTPERHQVTELPLVRPHVTEYQLHKLACECGVVNTGKLPAGVDRRMFGPRLTAFVGYLAGRMSLSHRLIVELMGECFGVKMSCGTVTLCEREVSLALREPVEELAAAVTVAHRAHADETGFWEGTKRTWLWVAVTDVGTLFTVQATRGQEGAEALLGTSFGGWLITDRWAAYDKHPLERRQVCWAHLTRQFAQMAEAKGEMGEVGGALVKETERMWTAWKALREGRIDRTKFRERMRHVREAVERALEEGGQLGHALSGRCREILSVRAALWSFVEHEGLEPTNNAAEQALRRAVIWRKLTHGTRSVLGSLFVGRILSALETLRRQGRNALEYLTEACTAKLWGQPAPALVAKPP